MQASQNKPVIQDVHVWDDREIVHSTSVVHFIFNQSTNDGLAQPNCSNITIQKSTYFNRMVTASVDSITPAIHKEYRPINSFKSLAQNLKALIANLHAQFSKPVEFKTIICRLITDEVNN